ncbi:hypothetical protein [Porphyromonas gingivalis]|uniref:hypothetical protein n=1 Tax=Porphyromonas gingivalis TaxID=837 RepID=UPI001E2CADE3|nr:hypothetical protein [Porphyromonas gingivalis]MDP0531315.1 hypothetical protein [Porphyromonas gingivalis]MDP0624912.1 hypothetical protein [Porphyromonas gingivalis]WKD51958.1 hypothetical protein NF669_06740 [Porphyromonas gingivalis]WKD54008.1 hypothetical protein NF668_06750 [Porphyromonas gingivalis]
MRTKIKYPVQTCRPCELLPSVLMEEADRKTGVKLHADTDFHNKKDDEAYLVFSERFWPKRFYEPKEPRLWFVFLKIYARVFFRFGSRNYFFPNQKQKIAAPRFLVPQMIIFLYVQAYPNYPPDKKFLPPEYRRELLTELLADDTILNDRG